MRYSAKFWIDHLKLTHHVEGGSFCEFYRSPFTIQVPEPFNSIRNASTSIYFLLEREQFSAFHKIKSDEIWHFYAGDPLVIFEIDREGKMAVHRLGNNPENNESFQCVISAGNWFASKVADNGEFSLVGCTVSPGFDFEDFELANANELSKLYPQHEKLIRSMIR